MEAYGGFEPEVGEIQALRSFRVGPGGVLYPLFGDQPWLPGTNTAFCKVLQPTGHGLIGHPSHSAPDPDCTCGFYAYADDVSAEEFPHSRHVLGVISCWGHVIAGTRGVRAQHARIEALWMSPKVPDDLKIAVAARHPQVSIHDTKPAMLAAHPPTVLDCYEIPTVAHRSRRERVLQLALLIALAVGSVPASWIWSDNTARLVSGAELAVFVIAALFFRLVAKDRHRRGSDLLYAVGALWLIAPFAGSTGILLRVPIVQVASLGLLYRVQLKREAGRFPASIPSV